MELQALRYAAMISAMTFDQLVEIFARYQSKANPDITAAQLKILEFLGWDSIDEEQFAQVTHVVLAAMGMARRKSLADAGTVRFSVFI
jgi:hypothetical protein